VQHAICG